MTHRTVDAGRPLRVLLVGAGGMGRNWIRTIVASPDVQIVGIVDLAPDVAAAGAALVEELGGGRVPTAAYLIDLATTTGGDAVIEVTVPRAHHQITTEALFLGLPVLGEKPAAATVAEALSLAATAELTGELFMVSQSRRYNDQLTHLRALVDALGDIGVVTHTFARAPRFGGFREQMVRPLLLDMAIHPFDTARALSRREPVSVYCESFNPTWSWFAGDAAATAIFEFEGGARFVYSGSWCSSGAETSWNGQWRLSAADGTALWDGDNTPVAHRDDGAPLTVLPPETSPPEIAGSLAEFVAALRSGERPQCEVHENIVSLAMVEAAVRSATTRQLVRIDDTLQRAYDTAVENEQRDDVRQQLRSWNGPRGSAWTAAAGSAR